jgi:hypothetical protein
MSRDWEIRANGYFPTGGSKHVRTGLAPVRSSSGGTTLAMRAIDERAFFGGDLEVGWRVPVFSPDGDNDLRVLLGGFYHGASNYADMPGPQARIELRVFDVPCLPQGSRFVVGGQYRWDDERGSWGTAIARIRIPINFRGYGEQKLQPMQRRMVERIDRSGVTTRRKDEIDRVTGPMGVPLGNIAYTDGTTEGDARSVPTAGEIETAIGVAGPGGIIVALDQTGPIDPWNDNETIDLLPGQLLMGGGSSVTLTGGGTAAVFTAPGGRGMFQTFDEITHLRLHDDNHVQSVDLDGGYVTLHAQGDDVSVWDVAITGTTTSFDDNLGITAGVLWEGARGSFTDSTIGDVSSNALRFGSYGVYWSGQFGNLQNVTIGNISSTDTFEAAGVRWSGNFGTMQGVTIGDVTADVVTSVASGLQWSGDNALVTDVSMGDVIVRSDGEVRGIWWSTENSSLARASIGDLLSRGDANRAIGLDWFQANDGTGSVSDVTIGEVAADGHADGVRWWHGDGALTNVSVGNVTSQQGSANGLLWQDGIGGTVTNFNVLGVSASEVASGLAADRGSASGIRTSFTNNGTIVGATVGNVSAGDGSAAGVRLAGLLSQDAVGLDVSDVRVGDVSGQNLSLVLGASGVATTWISDSTISNVTVGNVQSIGPALNIREGAQGIDLFAGSNLALSDITIGNVVAGVLPGNTTWARGIQFGALAGSTITNVTIGNVIAGGAGTGARAIGVDLQEDGLGVFGATIGSVMGDGAGNSIGIHIFNTSGNTANQISFATMGQNSIGVLFDGADASGNTGSGNSLVLTPLGFQRCIDNATINVGSNVEFNGLPCP